MFPLYVPLHTKHVDINYFFSTISNFKFLFIFRFQRKEMQRKVSAGEERVLLLNY